MNDLPEGSARKPDVPEEIQARWQRIVDLMARAVAVPAGLIMRVDPPQIEVFLSSATEGNPYEKGERADLNTGLYCETVMRERTPLLVPYALKDPEWDHNPDIKLGMTFYLGYPLTWPDGKIFGTICILDGKDNSQATQFRGLISEFQQVIERDLRLIVEAREREELLAEVQRYQHHLKEMVAERTAGLERNKRSLAEAQRVAHLGSWDWDIIHSIHHWSDEFYRIFGLLPQQIEATYEAFLASVHPDDRQAVHEANSASISDPDKPYSIEYRGVRPDGTERVVDAHAEVLFDQDLRPLRMIGTLQDITERKQAEDALKKAFDEIKTLKEQLEAENTYLREEMELADGFTDIVGVSDPIKYVMHRIRQVSRSNTTVLLTGETGSGKGVFARALHEASNRKEKPFVHVNCAGLPPNLIESELFGREKGAFTGSTARQIGRFELANGGTIFLDEIGELPLELQAKLLKVIEDGEFERLGSPYPVKVDVRIIASTNRDLEEEIQKGHFRKDLFYRLSVFPITIPPLSQRREDIPLLVEFYTTRFSKRHGKMIKRIPKNTMKALETYAWPGNVRELMNVIERAVIVSDGPELRLAEKIDALPNPLREEGSSGMELRETENLTEVERKHILAALQKTGWRITGESGAAQSLGINPSTLRARMKKLGIKRPGSV